jgi:TolB-like protein
LADIFLSYNRQDQAIARAYAEGLVAAGFTVWWDATLRAGEAYDEVTETALRTARAVVVLWSPRSVKSRWVRSEATVASRNGTLVPVTIEPCERPVMFELTQTSDMTRWRGEPDDAAWQALVQELRDFIGNERCEAPPGESSPHEAPASLIGVAAPALLRGVAAPALLRGVAAPALLRGVAAPALLRGVAAAVAWPAGPASKPATPALPLLAVLPFDNMSDDAEMVYFSDGISEEILLTTARARGLNVIGKTSSFQFRGAGKAINRIIADLKATHVLDGSVRRTGNRVRINAQLIDTVTQVTLWSERFDRDLTDIFALQDEIAANIAARLDAHFTPAESPVQIDPDAYDRFLKARAVYFQDMTSTDQAECIALLSETVTRAPDFAPAWGLLSMFRGLALARGGDGDAAAGRPAVQAAAERALALDPNCGPAIMALALLKPAFSDYAEKHRLAARAFRAAPEDATVAAFYAVSLATTGAIDAACAVFDAIVVREPLSPSYAATRAHFYRSAGRTRAALDMVSHTVDEFPNSSLARLVLGLTSAFSGDLVTAAEVAGAMPGATSLVFTVDFLTTANGLAGADRRAFAQAMLEAALPMTYIVKLGLAAAAGEADVAFDRLHTAIENGQPIAHDALDLGRGVARANTSAAFFGFQTEALRRDPRFAGVCVRLGLHDYWRESGEWPDCADAIASLYDFKGACAAAAAMPAA